VTDNLLLKFSSDYGCLLPSCRVSVIIERCQSSHTLMLLVLVLMLLPPSRLVEAPPFH